jgi:hypothetical protein
MNPRQDGALPNVSPRRRTSLAFERIGCLTQELTQDVRIH